MRRHNRVILIFLLTGLITGLSGQSRRILSYDEAVQIALHRSYTVKSYQEEKNAMQFYFNFYKAMFKPRMDLSVFAPSWKENVIRVQRPDGLPVYNSFGTMQFGADFTFTYMLPTGGNFALHSLMYRDSQVTTLPLQNYSVLRTTQAYTSLSLSFTQPVFTRNTLKENLIEAKYELERSTCVFTRQQMNIIYNVTAAYYNIYRLTRNVEIAQERLKNSEESLRIAQLKAKTGRIPIGDVLISRVDVATNKGNLSEAIASLQRSKDDFKQLIGLRLDDDFQILTDLKYDTFEVDEEKAIAEALKHRMELKEAELNYSLQEIRLDRAKRVRGLNGVISAYYDITGVSTIGAGTTRELFESSFNNFTDRPPNRGVTFTLSYPIFDWGRGSSRVRQEKANLNRRQLDVDNMKVTIIKQVRDIIRSLREAKNRLNILQQNQKVSERSYKISRIRFENGDLSSQDLSREQERLAQSRLDYLDAFITYQLTIADLKRKTLWDFKNNRSYLKEDYFSEK